MNTRISGRFAVKTLEFDKVKQNVAEKAATEQGKDRLMGGYGAGERPTDESACFF